MIVLRDRTHSRWHGNGCCGGTLNPQGLQRVPMLENVVLADNPADRSLPCFIAPLSIANFFDGTCSQSIALMQCS